ncbi:hypothetical protein [Nocardioides marmotae]|uniref:Cobyrinic acid a,c-diamide synthase n=1 Tax=Nocardioides marmotae TaxID=2663857 RepID=A0A6I3JH02_9ACTN|nr:hypothetical protein [Nocardioides marmotae]MBC9735458.1 hypothetical protein [Nocardioides marmotae]MCR6033803.1 hypothetical protein [Gordonia jinghuaiqii]MTB86555.1 hypothetical protein [Nocardioides marmotae]MTB97461.1 hypothetical protein [Nocardioides marmotae]
MARRVSLPSADELFRPTAVPDDEPPAPPKAVRAVPDRPADEPEPAEQPAGRRRPSGRVRHDEKMTVYVTSEELLEIEHARLALRRGQGLAVDRGRLVREAVALALADYEAHGDDSALVRRLTEG